MKQFSGHLRAVVLFAVVGSVICIVLLGALLGFGPSWKYEMLERMGHYPKAQDFPNSRWECQELDMYLNIFDNGEEYITGKYTSNSTDYRVVASLWMDKMTLSFYRSTATEDSPKNPVYVHCAQELYKEVYATYQYKDGVLACSFKDPGSANWLSEKGSLTFVQTGNIAQKPSEEWYCADLGMSLRTFEDVEGYYCGEMTITGEKRIVQAIEIGNGNYYAFSVGNAQHGLNKITTSHLVEMTLDRQGDVLIGRISDNVLANPRFFPYWEKFGVSFIFQPNESPIVS